jgi:hypothetical protein
LSRSRRRWVDPSHPVEGPALSAGYRRLLESLPPAAVATFAPPEAFLAALRDIAVAWADGSQAMPGRRRKRRRPPSAPGSAQRNRIDSPEPGNDGRDEAGPAPASFSLFPPLLPAPHGARYGRELAAASSSFQPYAAVAATGARTAAGDMPPRYLEPGLQPPGLRPAAGGEDSGAGGGGGCGGESQGCWLAPEPGWAPGPSAAEEFVLAEADPQAGSGGGSSDGGGSDGGGSGAGAGAGSCDGDSWAGLGCWPGDSDAAGSASTGVWVPLPPPRPGRRAAKGEAQSQLQLLPEQPQLQLLPAQAQLQLLPEQSQLQLLPEQSQLQLLPEQVQLQLQPEQPFRPCSSRGGRCFAGE